MQNSSIIGIIEQNYLVGLLSVEKFQYYFHFCINSFLLPHGSSGISGIFHSLRHRSLGKNSIPIINDSEKLQLTMFGISIGHIRCLRTIEKSVQWKTDWDTVSSIKQWCNVFLWNVHYRFITINDLHCTQRQERWLVQFHVLTNRIFEHISIKINGDYSQ